METYAEISIPDEAVLNSCSTNEPLDTDLSDLDALLEASMKAAKKPTIRRINKEVRKKVEDILEQQEASVQWEILDTISVWMQTTCSCGKKGDITFCRYMQKIKRTGCAKITHWEEIEEVEPEVEVRNSIVYRKVKMCGSCNKINEFELFQEVIK